MRKIVSKFKRLMLVLFFLVAVLAIPHNAQTQETMKTKTFVVIGTAPVQGTDVSTAREKAIDETLVTAVALMTGELLEVSSIVDNFSQLNELLLDQTSKFVQDYKVLTETAHGKSYRVVVQATVSGNKILKQLSDAGILRVQTTLPSVLFLIAEQNIEEQLLIFWWSSQGGDLSSVSETVMAQHLMEAGFVIIDHKGVRDQQSLVDWSTFDKPDLTDQEAAELGMLLKADVIVLGMAEANPSTNIMGSAMRSFNGTVTGRVIQANSAEQLLSFSRTAVAVNEDDIIGIRQALEDASDMAGQALAEELTIAWQKQADRPAVVDLVIRGTGHLASYVKFRKTLNTIAGVEGIRVKEIKPNESTLMVEYKGKTQDLAAALMLQNFESFGINIFEVTPDSLKLELIPG